MPDGLHVYPTSMRESAQVKRTREIEGLSNLYVIHPISRALVTVFARLGVSPNMVSVSGIGFGILAAWFYFQYQRWEFCVAGFVSMLMWHVMDGADGQLARLTGNVSELGRVMDGLSDHVTVALVYLSLATASSLVLGPWVWAVAILAGISHFGQSSAYEFQRQMYDYWVHRKDSSRMLTAHDAFAEMERKSGLSRAFARIYWFYVTVQRRFSAYDQDLQDQLEQFRNGDDVAFSRARDLYRTVNIPAMRRWSLMSNNIRTVAILIVCLLGQPVLYFVLEITVMNVLLLLLVRMQEDRYVALRVKLAGIGDMAAVPAVSQQA